MDGLTALLDISGRARRRTYWIVSIVGTLVVLTGLGLLLEERFADNLPVLGVAAVVVLAAFALIMVVSIRRLHDRGKSAWWMILYALLPGLFGPNFDGSGPLFPMLPNSVNSVLMMLSIGASFWAFLDLGCLRGSRGSNRFGPDPKGDVAAEVFS